MGYAIFDASYYPSPQLGVAAQMILDDMGDLYDKEGRDGALVSCVHPLQSREVEHIAKKYKRVIVGGPGALSPGAFEAASLVVLGDYRGVLAALPRGLSDVAALPNAYNPMAPAPVEIDLSFPYSKSSRYRGEDGRLQVFCSRGCKHRCAFCQTGWATTFSEHPIPESIINLPTHEKYNYMSNALSDVSFAPRLPRDISASHTLREAAHSNAMGRLVRVGVEGVSERLRRAVGKPISNENLVNWTLSLNERGVQVRWFMIAGLPGETTDDWEELRDCVKAYSMAHERGTLQISFTAYVPEPATPIASLPYSDDYYENYKRFADWYFNLARINHLSIFKCQGVQNRALKAAAQMHLNNRYVLYPHRDKLAAGLKCYKDAMK